MADLLTIPMQDDFETTLSSTWAGGTGTMAVTTTPTGTIPAGKFSYIVVNPGEANMQVAKIDGRDSGAKTISVSSIAVPKSQAGNYSAVSHAAGAVVRFSNNLAFWVDIMTAIASKADTTAVNAKVGDFAFTASKAVTPAPMTFQDNEVGPVTLKTLASAGGADQYVAVSATDTTVGHLNSKVIVGSGLTKTINNPGGAETMTISPDTNILATKTDIANIPVPSSFIITSDYPLGEPITALANSCVFKETAPTFAQATQAQNIGDVACNTRLGFPAIGTGVAGNILKLNLAKVVSPSVDLGIRIETDNAGSPSGTLVDANATATVDNDGVFSETLVNGHTFDESAGVNIHRGYKILTKNETGSDIYMYKVNKSNTCTATTAYLRSGAGAELATATFSGNTATFTTPYKLTNNTNYRVELGSGVSNYTYNYFNGTASFPVAGNSFSYVSGSNDGSDVTVGSNIESIETIVDKVVTFPASITVANGTKVHIVVSAVGDVVNESNYYKIGYSTNDTTTRGNKKWNGAAWVDQGITGSNIADGVLGSSCQGTGTYNDTYTITPTKNIYISTIATDYSSLIIDGETFTKVGGTITINRYFVSGRVYSFNFIGVAGTQYYSPLTVAQVNMSISPSSVSGKPRFTINSQEANMSGTSFVYTSSTLFHNTVLSLTDSDFSYKVIPYGVATALGAIGTYPKLTVFGASDNFTGMTEGGTQYLGPTPGGIQSTAGINSFVVGKARNSTKLRVKDLII